MVGCVDGSSQQPTPSQTAATAAAASASCSASVGSISSAVKPRLTTVELGHLQKAAETVAQSPQKFIDLNGVVHTLRDRSSPLLTAELLCPHCGKAREGNNHAACKEVVFIRQCVVYTRVIVAMEEEARRKAAAAAAAES